MGGHAGDKCKNKRPGHKSEATATTRLGGSTFGLPQGLLWLGSPTSNLNFSNNELNLEHLANFSKTETTCSVNPSTNLEQYGIADTGATQNCIRLNTPCRNKQKISDGPQVVLLDGSIMKETHRALLNPNPLLTQSARTAHIFPRLQSGALISIGQLCGDGCIATFATSHISVFKDGMTVLEGSRSSTSGMWKVNLTSNPIGPPIQQQPAAINALV